MDPQPAGLGFTLFDVLDAVSGWMFHCVSDPWRMENPNRHDLALFLRDAAHIEEGLEHYERYAHKREPSHVAALDADFDAAAREARKRREEFAKMRESR